MIVRGWQELSSLSSFNILTSCVTPARVFWTFAYQVLYLTSHTRYEIGTLYACVWHEISLCLQLALIVEWCWIDTCCTISHHLAYYMPKLCKSCTASYSGAIAIIDQHILIPWVDDTQSTVERRKNRKIGGW
jgi:hypothetical protein